VIKKTRVERQETKSTTLNWKLTPAEKKLIQMAAAKEQKSVALFVMDYLMPHVKRMTAK
jgi:uncharacterized protein (DUF1778 family)